jgi:lysophospholipase L1-like esterase
MRRFRLAPLFAGLVFALFLLEGAFRAYPFLRGTGEAGSGKSENGLILVVGNSHTKGMLPNPGYSYPDQLALALRAKAGARAPRVENAGELNVNSAEILAILERKLPELHPSVVVIMAGEANTWNRRHAAASLGGGGPLAWLVEHSRAVRFFTLALDPDFRNTLAKPRAGYSRFFLDTPLRETPTLAMRWTGHLSSNRKRGQMPVANLEEAASAISAWLSDPRAGTRYFATEILADLELYLGHADRSFAALEAFAGRSDRHFNEPLLRFTEEKREALVKAGTPARYAALVNALSAGGFSRKDFDRILSSAMHADKSLSTADLERASRADTGNLFLASQLGERWVREGKKAEAVAYFAENLRDNPFQSAGEVPPSQFFQFLEPAEYRRMLADALPPDGDPSSKARYLRESLLSREEVAAWAYADLVRMIRVAKASGAGVLLQTYPPERFTGRDRPVDSVIRRVAQEENVPLSDTSRALEERWGRDWSSELAARWYGTPGIGFPDDHLNGDGNRLVGELLAHDLETSGLWRP